MNTKQHKQSSPRASLRRSAFTIIELLLVIAIVAVLGSLAVGVIESAQQDARVSATQARVQMIEKLMEVELEDYEVRRSPLPFNNIGALVARIVLRMEWNGAPANLRLHAKNLKRMITLDLIRAEMPDFQDGNSANLGQFPTPRFIRYLTEDLKLTEGSGGDIDTIVRAAYQGHTTANVFRWTSWQGANAANSDPSANSAEVLYRILSDLDVDGTNGIDVLGAPAVGDTDGDGFLEIVDAWGEPLRFDFHQRIIIPAEQNVAAPPTFLPPMRSGVWEIVNPMLFPGFAEVTDFNVVLPNLPSEIEFYVTSDRLLETDTLPINFRFSDPNPPNIDPPPSNPVPHLRYQFIRN